MLGIPFIPRESSYWGGVYYTAATADAVKVKVYVNHDSSDDTQIDVRFPPDIVILCLSGDSDAPTMKLLSEMEYIAKHEGSE